MTNKSFLEELYFGNVMPFDRKVRRGSKVDKIAKIAEENIKRLTPLEKSKGIFTFGVNCAVQRNRPYKMNDVG